jgi:hypothetical protein
MRPIRVTGITGVSPPVPLDVYMTAGQTIVSFTTAGAPTLTVTSDDVFNLAITPKWVAPPTAANANGQFTIPPGIRAVQGNGMVPADVLVVSQQGLQ